MEVIDIQAVKDCLAEVSDCEDKQYAIALLEWAIGKRTFDLDEHDSKLLDKFVTRLKDYFVIPHDVSVIEQMAEEMKADIKD